MVFSNEDKILIKSLHLAKGYGAKKLVSEFPMKNWNIRTVSRLLKKVRETGSTDRKLGSGRPRTARTDENIEAVAELILSQENRPQTHKSTRQISRLSGIKRSSVIRIVHTDLKLKCIKKCRAQELTAANRTTRRLLAQQLLKRFSVAQVDFIFFSDEKVFTVAAPKTAQNDRLYVPTQIRKRQVAARRLLRTRPTFSASIMVSVAVSKLGMTELFFVDPGTKINGQYYRDILLSQQLLPAIGVIAGDVFVFQQDNAPAHRARETVALLQRATPDFIEPTMWPANSPDLNPVDYKVWGWMQDRVYRQPVADLTQLKERILQVWSVMPQNIIDEAISDWRKRLRACVEAEGGHFEYLL
jgi:inhibitor of nuclear factor kappa-B kinase subunit alpha